MTNKRFARYLLDGGFSFDDEYVPPRWSIIDRKNNKSPFGFLEFKDEYKDKCDEVVDELNLLTEENNGLIIDNEELKHTNRELYLENQRLQSQLEDCLENQRLKNQLEDCVEKAKEEIRREKEDAAIRWANIGR